MRVVGPKQWAKALWKLWVCIKVMFHCFYTCITVACIHLCNCSVLKTEIKTKIKVCMWKAHRGDKYAGSKPTQYINLHTCNVEGLSWVIQSSVHHSLNLRSSEARFHQQPLGLDFWRDFWDPGLVRISMLSIHPCCFDETWIHNVKPHFPAFRLFPVWSITVVRCDVQVVGTTTVLARCC